MEGVNVYVRVWYILMRMMCKCMCMCMYGTYMAWAWHGHGIAHGGMGMGMGMGACMCMRLLTCSATYDCTLPCFPIAPLIVTLLYQRRWSSPSSSCRTVARRASPRTCAMRSSTSSRRTAVVLPGACVRACVLSSVCLSVCAAAGAAHWLDIASL